MGEVDLEETVWTRGGKDAKAAWGDWRFWFAEVFGGGVIAIWDAQLALIFVAALAFAVWALATTTAPVRQRNDLREAHSSLHAKINDLQNDKPDLRVKFESLISGGNTPEDQGRTAFSLTLTVTNRGNRPSAASNWRIRIRSGGREIYPELFTPESYTLVSDEGTISITSADRIDKKLVTALKPGEMVQGLLPAVIKRSDYEFISDKETIVSVLFEDIYDNVVEKSETLNSNNSGQAHFKNLPGMEVKYVQSKKHQNE